jgi:hypothetical protein
MQARSISATRRIIAFLLFFFLPPFPPFPSCELLELPPFLELPERFESDEGLLDSGLEPFLDPDDDLRGSLDSLEASLLPEEFLEEFLLGSLSS